MSRHVNNRPKIYTKWLTLRVEPDMFERLKQTAVREKVELRELVRTFIEWGLEQ